MSKLGGTAHTDSKGENVAFRTCAVPAKCPLVLRHTRDAERLESALEYARRLYEAQRHLIRCLDGERSATRMYAAEAAKRERDQEWCRELGDAMVYCQGRTYRARAGLRAVEDQGGAS